MWRAAVKGALGHRARLTISGLVVSFAVAFVVATLVFTDTLSSTFENLFEDSFAGFDLQVRSEIDPDLPFSVPAPLDEALLGEVEAVEGVAQAQGTVTGFLQLVAPDGTPVETGGPPTFGLSWPEVPSIARARLGAPPATADEVAIDAGVASRIGADVGSTVTIIGLGGPVDVTISGIIEFAGADSVGGAVSVFMTTELAQRMFDLAGRYSTIEVVAEGGVDTGDLAQAIESRLGSGFEAISSEALARQQVDAFKEAIGFIRTFVLVFAGVALFVGTFVISNIFRVTVAQRTRELAVLRAIGATAAQIRKLMLLEALVISAIASAVGVGLGMVLALLIEEAFQAAGIGLPDSPLRTSPLTITAGVATGVLVTMGSALIPAFKASAVTPVEAMREGLARPSQRHLRTRSLVGTPITVTGGGLLAAGLFVEIPAWAPDPIWWVGTGAALLFLGVAVLAAVIAKPVASVLGSPVARLRGVAGRLARENAMRSPRRTGLTASALMISLALVGLVSILADSGRVTADAALAERFRADLILAPSGFGGFGFSPEVARRVDELDEVAEVGNVRQGQILLDGQDAFVTGASPEAFDLLSFEVLAGDLGDLGGETIALRENRAEGLSIGDPVTVTFGAAGVSTLRLVAVYDSAPATGLIGMDTFEAGFTERLDSQVLVRFADSVDFEAGRSAVEDVVAAFPGVQIQDQEAFRNEASSRIGGIVNILYALLAVSIVIGTLGVVGTLLLSVVERTKEIGMLRAVGMARRQVRAMITWEAVIITVFGGVLGTTIGLLFGWSVVTAIGDNLTLSLPLGRLVLWMGVAAVLGVLAAVYPARRGSRLNVLEAIAYE